MTDKEKIKSEIKRQIAELTPTKEKIGIVGCVAVKRHLESILSFIDSLQKESTGSITSKQADKLIEQSKEIRKQLVKDKLNSMLNNALSKETKESLNEMLDKKNFRERYKRIAQSEQFKKTHEGMSIGEVIPIEDEEPASEKKCIFTKDNYTDEDRKVLCEDCEEECKFNKKEEPVSEDLETELNKYIKGHFTIDTEQLDRFGIEEKDYMYSMDKSDMLALVEHFTNWQKSNLWKPADGDDLPEIDREVIALLDNGKVVFAHRPPEYWDGKNIVTGKVTRNYPKTYDKGGWNIPNIVYWLDVELPKEIEL